MATRSKRFLAGVLTGYGSIAANVIFTLVSIPLALHFLDKERFGLWALALQINGYLALIDMGMGVAVSRFIADHKDDVNGGEYGSLLLTGGLVFVIQGILIVLAGLLFSIFAPQLFAVPAEYAQAFRYLLIVLSTSTGASVALRAVCSPLWSFQRIDIINGCASGGLLVTLLCLWIALQNGGGVMSFAYAQLPAIFGTILIQMLVCLKNGYYPKRGHWGRFSAESFRQMFHFGKDNVIITVGTQLINASQIMILSRWISLEAATTFSVATKFYTMAMQLVGNPISSSSAGLTEIFVRGDKKLFTQRYWDLITIATAISTIAAVGLAIGNSCVVLLWTKKSIEWSWHHDVILAALIVLRNASGCFMGLFGIMRNWKPVRLICLTEGLVFVPLAIFLAGYLEIFGILIASLVAHLAVTTAMSAKAASSVIGSWRQQRSAYLISISLVIASAIIAWLGQKLETPPLIMLGVTAVAVLITMGVVWHGILSPHIRARILSIPAIAKLKLGSA